MPKSQFQQTSFASGELSPLLKGRTDLDQYYQGAQQAEGVVIVPQGGVKRRPGLEHIDSVLSPLFRQTAVTPAMPNGGTGSAINDGNALTGASTNYSVSASPYVVAQYDFASYVPEFISVENAFLTKQNTTADVSKTLTLQYSANGSAWSDWKTFSISSDAGVGGVSKRYDVTSLSDANNRYWRITTNLGNTALYKINIGEFNAHQSIGANKSPKVFEWQYAPDHSFVCVLTQYNLRIYRTPHLGVSTTDYVADIPMPYTGAFAVAGSQVDQVRVAQTENVMLLFQEDNYPYKIVFNGTDDVNAFESNIQTFINIPQFDYNDASSPIPVAAVQTATFTGFHAGQTYQIDVDGVLSKDITFAGSTAGDQANATAANMRQALQDMPVFGFTGITVEKSNAHDFTITMAGESANSYGLFAGFATSGDTSDTIGFAITTPVGAPRTEDVWSATRGFPKMGVFNEGRLWLGGTKSKPQSILASRSGAFFDFYSKRGEDDEGIFVTIDSRELTNIVDINPDRGLQIFCSGAEFLLKGFTPSTIEIIAQTQHGSYPLEVQSIDGATLFVDKNGRTLRQYLFSFNEDAYTSNDISVLSSQLISNPKDMAILKGSTTEDANWLFIINEDGNAGVLNTMRNQDINGFTRWTTPSGNVLDSCCTVDNNLYVVTERTFGPSGASFLERWSFDSLLDASVKKTVTATGSDVVVAVGTQLNDYTVSVLADGDVLPDRVCTSGNITITAAELDGFTTRSLEVGLNFNVKVKSMPLNTNPGTRSGQNTMKRKKITNINLRVYESAGVYVDGNPVAIRQFGAAPDTPLNTPFVPKTGIIEDNRGGNGWDTEVVPEITVPDATPFHLQVIQYEVESS